MSAIQRRQDCAGTLFARRHGIVEKPRGHLLTIGPPNCDNPPESALLFQMICEVFHLWALTKMGLFNIFPSSNVGDRRTFSAADRGIELNGGHALRDALAPTSPVRWAAVS